MMRFVLLSTHSGAEGRSSPQLHYPGMLTGNASEKDEGRIYYEDTQRVSCLVVTYQSWFQCSCTTQVSTAAARPIEPGKDGEG